MANVITRMWVIHLHESLLCFCSLEVFYLNDPFEIALGYANIFVDRQHVFQSLVHFDFKIVYNV